MEPSQKSRAIEQSLFWSLNSSTMFISITNHNPFNKNIKQQEL